MCSRKKISLPRQSRAIVVVTKIRAAVIRARAPEPSRKHAREQKQIAPALEKGMPFRALNRVRRHNRGVSAITGGGLHRFFERARYFHDARNSGMIAGLSPMPADFLRISRPSGGLRHVNDVKTGDIPC
ncbi:hypothetical protein NXC12_CH00489 [Rhizobium etli]|uniref:Uncharacterized protein n=1 Tax=Rhizobium etli TaxID=29449 RepID=A0AAN1BCI9_RHIET|nr:hypothetical protein NXC12_CH00489 [Rhizobium etli]